MRIDKSGKLPATILLRALSGENGDHRSLLSHFYDIETIDLQAIPEIDAKKKLVGGVLVDDIQESDSEDLLYTALSEIKDSTVKGLYNAGLSKIA